MWSLRHSWRLCKDWIYGSWSTGGGGPWLVSAVGGRLHCLSTGAAWAACPGRLHLLPGRVLMPDYDSPWEEMLDGYFPAFIAFFFPEAHADIDWTRGYESLDTELQQIVHDAALGTRLADKLMKVWRRVGTPWRRAITGLLWWSWRICKHRQRAVTRRAGCSGSCA